MGFFFFLYAIYCVPPFTFSHRHHSFLCSLQHMAMCFYCKQRLLIPHQGPVLLYSSCMSVRQLKRAKPITALVLFLGLKGFRKAFAIPARLSQTGTHYAVTKLSRMKSKDPLDCVSQNRTFPPQAFTVAVAKYVLTKKQ